MVPTHTLFGIMMALIHRKRTGEGQLVEIPQSQAAICMKPVDAMTYAANGDILGPMGHRDANAAPHGIYRTLGYRKWIAVSVFTDNEWEALKSVMGNPAWADENKFKTLADRKKNEDELDGLIEEWTQWQYADLLMNKLISNGVRAGVVNDARGVIEDAHLKDRGFWAYMDHPVVGITLYNMAPIRFSETPIQMKTAAPLLGQHTNEVLTNMLGYTSDEIKQLEEAGALT
jgi:benzylsuccinate CoA-transferase BbsF subunit/naphthyl-2-methylsuccinate CoA transferase subunit